MYQIYFYVPKEDAGRVKEAMFKAGAGKIGNYDYCAWQSLGQGQFRAQNGANPTIGTIDKVEYVEEYRVEMVCETAYIKAVLEALLRTHPYEEVAYGVLEIKTIDDFKK